MKELGIYVHIPFCVQKCLYCDFYSMPAEDSVKSAYAESVITQIEAESEKYRDNYLVVSIFFGGGTPSTMDSVLIRRIIRAIRDGFLLDEDCEISLECNPATVDAGTLREYRTMGINRISMGLQSANDEELRAIGRIHDFKDFMKTYEAVMLAGFDDVRCASLMTPPLTTIHQPCNDLALLAYKSLRERIKNPDLPSRKILLPAPLVVRESTINSAGPNKEIRQS